MLFTKSNIETELSRKCLCVLAILLILFLPGCSVDIDGSEWHLGTTVRGNFDYDYTAGRTVTDEVAVHGHTRITVAAMNGEVCVEGRSDTRRVMITANLSVGSSSQTDADLHLEDLEMRVSEDGHEILIETIQPEWSYGRGYRVEYDIIIPEGLEVMATQDNGRISVYDLKNNVEVTNVNGDIQLLNIVGNVRAQLVNGTIETEVIMNENGVLDIETVNGRIELSIPTITSANFMARVDNAGTVFVHNLVFTDSSSTSKSYEGTLGNGDGFISLRTHNGDIDVFGVEL